ncbi:Hypothetical predicted protein, partial [Paramuricea clavata]
EYERKKRGAFRISVQKVYQAIKNESAEDRKLQELEDKFLGKRKQDDSLITIELSDPEGGLSLSSDSEFSEDEMRKNVPTGNLVNRSMHEMYKTSNSRKNSEDETERPTNDASNSSQIFTEVIMRVNYENATPSPDNRSNLNENETSISAKNNDVTNDVRTPNVNSISETPGLNSEPLGDRMQRKKLKRKDGSSSRSKETQKKASVKDILTDDSGTN